MLSLLLERGFELRLRSNSLQIDPYRWCSEANLSTDSVDFLALIRPMDAPVLREPLCTANPMNPILEIASLHTLWRTHAGMHRLLGRIGDPRER